MVDRLPNSSRYSVSVVEKGRLRGRRGERLPSADIWLLSLIIGAGSGIRKVGCGRLVDPSLSFRYSACVLRYCVVLALSPAFVSFPSAIAALNVRNLPSSRLLAMVTLSENETDFDIPFRLLNSAADLTFFNLLFSTDIRFKGSFLAACVIL